MRALLTFLITLCLFFLKGNSSDFSESGPHTFYNPLAQKIQNKYKPEFSTPRNAIYEPEFSLFSDDNDDDEFSPEKKKQNHPCISLVFGIAYLNDCQQSLFDNPTSSYNNPAYRLPHRYIFQRSIRI
jgi:hypothetical protein